MSVSVALGSSHNLKQLGEKDITYVLQRTDGTVYLVHSHMTRGPVRGPDKLEMRRYAYVMDNTYSVIAALVGWVFWRLCHQQPDSSIAGGSCRHSGD